MALPYRALEVLDQMVQHGLGERPLFFICHSLGGLVAKQLLRTSRDDTRGRLHPVFTNTRAVLFLATPQMGVNLASLVNTFREIFGATVTIEDLRAHDAHLGNLYDWYRNHSEIAGIHTATYFETRSVGILTIVNRTTAHPGVGADPIPSDEHHLSIAKPFRRDSQVCGAATDILRKYVLASKAALSSRLPVQPILADEPGDRPGRPIPHELPPGAEKFFGRQDELKKLVQRLLARKNTAVIGAAGLGKTALASRALTDIVGETYTSLANSLFPDGVVFLDLYALRASVDAICDALANKLAGPSFMESVPSRERAIYACQGRNILVVIEGGEEADGVDGRADINDIRGSRGVPSLENRCLLLTRNKDQAPGLAAGYLSFSNQPSPTLCPARQARRSLAISTGESRYR